MSTDIPKPERPSAATIKKASRLPSEIIYEMIVTLDKIHKDCPTLKSVQTNISEAMLRLKPAKFLLESNGK